MRRSLRWSLTVAGALALGVSGCGIKGPPRPPLEPAPAAAAAPSATGPASAPDAGCCREPR